MTPIYENYLHYTPPRWVRASIERLLASLAPEHTGGLQSIVLTNSAAMRRGKTRRVGGRKYVSRLCRGFYHAEWRGERAWIEIVVNTTIPRLPRGIFFFRFVRDAVLARVLYHEIGHHLDATVGSAARGGEASAEDWRSRLTRLHFRKRYWYLRPLLAAINASIRAALRVMKRRASK